MCLCAYYHIANKISEISMPKNYNMKEIILELLAGKELSKKELLENIRKESLRSTWINS